MKKSIQFLIGITLVLISCSKDSEKPTEPDVVAPSVNFSIAGFSNSTSGNAILVSNQIEININAQDSGGISKVEAFIDDEKVGEDSTAPFQIIVDISSFSSKKTISGKYKDHVLEITATDIAGNTNSTSQTINIDNELPTISVVSIVEDQILNGETNELTFSVSDNEGLESVAVFINDGLLATIENETYEENIDTTILQDGVNTLKLEATDSAGNLGLHTVNFIVDNSGPSILIESLVDNQILDEAISIQPELSDSYSEITSLEIFFDNESLFQTNDVENILFDFDPENYPVGLNNFRFEAEDVLGNVSTHEVSVEIKRLLITLNIPDGYLSPNFYSRHFVFTSLMNGDMISAKEILFETRVVKLHAIGEFSKEENYMITFASLVGLEGNSSYLFTVQNLNREQNQELNLEIPKRFGGSGQVQYPISGFSETSSLNCFGRDYYFSSTEAGDTVLTPFNPTNHNISSEKVYIYNHNPQNGYYSYDFVAKPIPADYEMRFDQFSTENLITGSVTTLPTDHLTNNRSSLQLFGYTNQSEIDNDIFHSLWGYGYGSMGLSSYDYPLNTNFLEYSHQLTIGNYRSEGLGLPPNQVEIPNWSVDFIQVGNTIQLTKSGIGHHTGDIYFNGGYDVSAAYEWGVVFNSQTMDQVTLPQIPSIMNYSKIYEQYSNGSFELKKVEIKKYDATNNYTEYLDQILFTSKFIGRATPRFESIYSPSEDGYYYDSERGFFFNWW